MNALELADCLSPDLPQVRRIDAEHAGEMLRRQYEAIQKLREAIRIVIDYSAPPTLASVEDWVRLRNALKDTEEYK